MTFAYSFGVIRYYHDVVTREFVNLGVVVFSPDVSYLRALCTRSYTRVTAFFDRANGPEVRSAGTAVENLVNGLVLGEPLLFRGYHSQDISRVVAQVLPPDDSAIQFESIGAGVTGDLDAELSDLFRRHVDRYARAKSKEHRTDEQVLRVFRHALEERQLSALVEPKVIETAVYKHEFPIAWKNGVWNSAEAVSFDLIQPSSIVEKANTWLGRLHSLSATPEDVRVHLLLGKPTLEELQGPYLNAKSILLSAPLGTRLYEESGATAFADMIAGDIENRKATGG